MTKEQGSGFFWLNGPSIITFKPLAERYWRVLVRAIRMLLLLLWPPTRGSIAERIFSAKECSLGARKRKRGDQHLGRYRAIGRINGPDLLQSRDKVEVQAV